MLRRALVRAVLCPIIAGLTVAPAVARQAPDDVITRVASVSPFVDATHPLRVVGQVVNVSELALDGATARVSIYAGVFSRSQLREAVDQGPNTPLLSTITQPLDEVIAPGGRVVIEIEREAADVDAFTRTGVYPVEIAIEAGAEQSVRRTAIPYLASAPETRLNLTWLLSVATPPALRAGGVYDERALEAARLDVVRQQMEVLAERPDLALTFAPQGSLVDMLADLADGYVVRAADGITTERGPDSTDAVEAAATLDAMRRAAVVASEIALAPYASAHLSALAANGLRSEIARQTGASRRAVEEHLERAPGFRLLVPPRFALGTAETETLTTLGLTGVAIDPESLAGRPVAPAELQDLRYDLFGPSRPTLLRADRHRLGGLLIDRDLRARLEGGEQGVLLAQTLIAETASSWLEIPLLADERLLVMSSRTLPAPPALAAALDGLASAPWVRLRTASGALTALPPTAPPVPLPSVEPPDRPYLAAARRARDALETLLSIAIDPHPRADELERMALLAESQDWNANPVEGAALARSVTEAVEAVTDGVRVVPRVVTLTSRTGAMPVTLINEGGVPVRLRVRLVSPKATFPSGNARVVDIGTGQVTLDFRVEARAAGAFPVTILVETPDGARVLRSGRVVLRSTAVSAVALAAIGGGALVLIVGSIRRGRRRRTPRGTGSPAGE